MLQDGFQWDPTKIIKLNPNRSSDLCCLLFGLLVTNNNGARLAWTGITTDRLICLVLLEVTALLNISIKRTGHHTNVLCHGTFTEPENTDLTCVLSLK